MSRLGLGARAVAYGRMIKFSHSVFALPFALSAAVLAGQGHPGADKLLWILVAMLGARSAAMGFNRLADHALDARNPRTAGRELPRGVLSRIEVRGFVVVSALALVVAAWRLNPLCLMLSPLALAVVLGYSYAKRFTSLSHLWLGLGLGLAPLGAWIAIRGQFDVAPVVLAAAVLAWVAGFDILYSCQDVDFDRSEGLRSLPARWGVGRALLFARALHALAAALLACLYWLAPLRPLYLAGVAGVAGLLVYEHSLVREDDLSRVDAAFFTLNGWISLGYLATTVLAASAA